MVSPLTGTGAAIAQPETHTTIAQFKHSDSSTPDTNSRSLLPKRGETPVIETLWPNSSLCPNRGRGAVIATKQMHLTYSPIASQARELTNRYTSALPALKHKPSHGDTAVNSVYRCSPRATHEPPQKLRKKVSQPQSGGKKRMSRRTPTCTCKVWFHTGAGGGVNLIFCLLTAHLGEARPILWRVDRYEIELPKQGISEYCWTG